MGKWNNVPMHGTTSCLFESRAPVRSHDHNKLLCANMKNAYGRRTLTFRIFPSTHPRTISSSFGEFLLTKSRSSICSELNAGIFRVHSLLWKQLIQSMPRMFYQACLHRTTQSPQSVQSVPSACLIETAEGPDRMRLRHRLETSESLIRFVTSHFAGSAHPRTIFGICDECGIVRYFVLVLLKSFSIETKIVWRLLNAFLAGQL